jgi:hypothetical protein
VNEEPKVFISYILQFSGGSALNRGMVIMKGIGEYGTNGIEGTDGIPLEVSVISVCSLFSLRPGILSPTVKCGGHQFSSPWIFRKPTPETSGPGVQVTIAVLLKVFSAVIVPQNLTAASRISIRAIE